MTFESSGIALGGTEASRGCRATCGRGGVGRELAAEARRAGTAAGSDRRTEARDAPLASTGRRAARVLPRRLNEARGRRTATCASSSPSTIVAGRRLARRVDKVRLDPASFFARLLVECADAVDFEGVRLQVELGFEDDELLREAVGVRAEEVVGLEMLLLQEGERGGQ